MNDPFYRTSFSRHVHSLINNGFWSRYLDADDRQFLEYVQRHGIANGNLPGNDSVLLEELEFWHLPYAIAPNIERRVGRAPRPVETAEHRAIQQARADARQARRVIRAQERVIAAAEQERERREWEKAREIRKIRELVSDLEWEEAAPAPFGKTINRHHIPEWKLEEQGDTGGVRKKKPSRQAFEIAKQQAIEAALERQREQEQEQEQLRKKAIESRRKKQQREWKREQADLERKLKREAEKKQNPDNRERKRRERIIKKARQTVERVNQLERKWASANITNPDVADLKQAILNLIRGSAPYVWSVEEMHRSLGYPDHQLLKTCLTELKNNGRLKVHGKP